MAVVDLSIRQGDTEPVLNAVLTSATGAALNLTGASVRFVMRNATASTPVVDAAATIVTASTGAVRYSWRATDTAAPGFYSAEFHVTLTGGGTYTWPNTGYLSISIEPSLVTTGAQEFVTLADAKGYLNIPSTDHSQDAKILRFVRMCRPLVENITGPIIPTQYEEWHDGGHTFIRLRRRPSTAPGTSPTITLQAISEYDGPIEWPLAIVASPDEGQLYSAMLTLQLARVVRRTTGGGVQPFPGQPQSVHVWYVAGQSSVPDNVYEATLELLRVNYQKTQQQSGLRVGSGVDVDEEIADKPYTGFFVPGRVKEMLAPNRRHPALA